MSPLEIFILFYAIISFGYLIYRYAFAVTNIQVPGDNAGYFPSVSIVIPCYNEEKKYLKRCIASACGANYPNKEVIVVDDGSSDQETPKNLEELREKYDFKLLKFGKNRGKRHAMAEGFRNSSGEILITMDSDTVIPSGKDIQLLVAPFVDKDVGSVSGITLVENRKKNLLTRVQDARYWLAFNVDKLSQDFYDTVTCTPGPFSAHRKKYFMRFLDRWENQHFLGIECTYGDDRGITTFMIRAGYKIKFIKDAFAFTYVPETFMKFLKQQIRWKKSFCRENWYYLKFLHRRSVFANIEFYLFWMVFFSGFVAKIITMYFLAVNPYLLPSFFMMIIFVAMIHYIYMFIRSPGVRGIYGIVYGFLNEFIISWLIFAALFNLNDTKWGTR